MARPVAISIQTVIGNKFRKIRARDLQFLLFLYSFFLEKIGRRFAL
jgi:hypothetical protein